MTKHSPTNQKFEQLALLVCYRILREKLFSLRIFSYMLSFTCWIVIFNQTMLKPRHLSRQLFFHSFENNDLSASDDGNSGRSAWNRRVGQKYSNKNKYCRNNGFRNRYENFGPEKIQGRLIHKRKHRNTWMKERYVHHMVQKSELRMVPMSSIHNHQPAGWRNRRLLAERIQARDYQSMIRVGNWKSPALMDGLIQVNYVFK
jgi:hypothetical protein